MLGGCVTLFCCFKKPLCCDTVILLPSLAVAVLTVGCKYSVKAGQVNSGFRYQRNQSGDGRSSASCARAIPYILYIKSSGSNMTCVAPDGDGYGLRVAQEVP